MSIDPLFLAIGPEICIGASILCLVFIERFHGFSWRWSRILSIVGLISSIGVLSRVFSGPILILDSIYIADPYTSMFKLTILLISLLLMIGTSRNQFSFSGSDFHLPVLLGTLGAMLCAGASDLFMLYLSVELTGFSSIFLLMILKSNLRSYRTYFFHFTAFQAMGSICLLAGTGCITMAANASRYSLIRNSLLHVPAADLPLYFIGLFFLLIGLCIKWNLIPFHYYSLRFFPENAIQFFVWFFLIICAAMTAALGRLIEMIQPIIEYGIMNALIVVALGVTLGGALTSLHAAPIRKFGLFLLAQQGFIIFAVLSDSSQIPAITQFSRSSNSFLIISLMCLSNGFFLIFPERFQIQGSSVDQHPGDQCGLLILLGTISGIPLTLGFYSRILILEWTIAGHHFIACSLVALASLLLLVISIQLALFYGRASSITSHARIESLCLGCLCMLLVGFGVNPSGMMKLFESILHSIV